MTTQQGTYRLQLKPLQGLNPARIYLVACEVTFSAKTRVRRELNSSTTNPLPLAEPLLLDPIPRPLPRTTLGTNRLRK